MLVTAVSAQKEINQYIDRVEKRVEEFNAGGCGQEYVFRKANKEAPLKKYRNGTYMKMVFRARK